MAANGFTIAGFCIHVLTASGAACALLALMAAVEAKWAAMFAWLGVALVVDAIDGPLARGLLPEGLETASGILVVATGALYFADRRMKTPDNYFRGFPALWNLAAFYLFLLRPGPWPGVARVVVLCCS